MSEVIDIERLYDNLGWIFRVYGILIQFREEQPRWRRRKTKREESQVYGIVEVREIKISE